MFGPEVVILSDFAVSLAMRTASTLTLKHFRKLTADSPHHPGTLVPRNPAVGKAGRDALRSALLALLYESARRYGPEKPLLERMIELIRERHLFQQPLIEGLSRPELEQLNELERAVKSNEFFDWLDRLSFDPVEFGAPTAGRGDAVDTQLVPAVDEWFRSLLKCASLPDPIREPLHQGWCLPEQADTVVRLGDVCGTYFGLFLSQRPELCNAFIVELLTCIRDDQNVQVLDIQRVRDEIERGFDAVTDLRDQIASVLSKLQSAQAEVQRHLYALIALAASIASAELERLHSQLSEVGAAFTRLERQLFGLPLTRPQARVLQADTSDLWLVQASYRSIELVDHNQNLDDLRQWLETEARVSIRLLVGGAGSGKTRLAYELMWDLALRSPDWESGLLSAADLQKLVNQQYSTSWDWWSPTLAVIDYARASEAALRKLAVELAVRSEGGGPPLRLLLLERTTTGSPDWLESLAKESKQDFRVGEILDPPRPVEIRAVDDPEHRRNIFRAALQQLPNRLPCPDPGDQPEFDNLLRHPDWRDPLVPLMAALIADEGGHVLSASGMRKADLGKHLAERERKRLLRGLHIEPGTKAAEVSSRVAAWIALAGDCTEADLLQWLTHDFDQAALNDNVGELAHRFRSTWASSENGIVSPQPDIVAEAFVVEHLLVPRDTDSAQFERLANHVQGHEARTINVLVRVYEDFQSALQDTEAMQRLIDWLTRLARRPIDEGDGTVLAELFAQIPHSTVELAPLALSVKTALLRIVESRESGEFNVAWRALLNLEISKSLSAAGRHAEAVDTNSNAIELLRELTQRDPAAYCPDLALSLNNHSTYLSQVGRHNEALWSVDEAVGLYGDIAQRQPGVYSADLARSLSNRSISLSALGRYEEAHQSAKEAVALYRALVQRYPDTYRLGLAKSLNNLCSNLSAMGRVDEAFQVSDEAVGLLRELSHLHPDAYRLDFSKSLINHSNLLTNTRRYDAALQAATEAVRLTRMLEYRHPDAYRETLAKSLITYARALIDLNCHHDALQAISEAIGLFRVLDQLYPTTHRIGLAMSLSNSSNMLAAIGDHDMALQAVDEAVELLRELTQHSPKAYGHYLVKALINQGRHLSTLGREVEARRALAEAQFRDLRLRLRNQY